jgi:protease I
VVDRNLVSSRRPPDLPEYGKALIKLLEQGSR